jgi:glycosyltransferase involved in cell wall biosynthesis
MKIYFITSKLNFVHAGGSVEEFDLMIRTLRELVNDVTAVTVFSHANDIPAELPYRVIKEQITSRGLIGIQKQAYRILKKYERDADVFHIDGHLLLYAAGCYRRLGGRVPVHAFFNRELMCWPDDESTLFRQYKKHVPLFVRMKKKIRWCVERYAGMPIANGIDAASFISPQYRDMYERFGFRRGGIVTGDPVDFDKIMREGRADEAPYAERATHDGPITLFYSSRMAPGKGFDMLLEGFSRVRSKEQFRLILGGSGPEEPFVRRRIGELNLEPYVTLTGWMSKDELFAQYRRADIFIQADWRLEGTSISLLYAMAFGVPSIIYGGGGLEWVAKDCAICFRYRDPDDLARSIERLGGDAEARQRLSANCRRRIREDELNYRVQIGRMYEEMKRISGKRRL